MTSLQQAIVDEGLKLIGEALAKGAVEAATKMIHTLRSGVAGKVSIDAVRKGLDELHASITANHAAEDQALHDKYSDDKG